LAHKLGLWNPHTNFRLRLQYLTFLGSIHPNVLGLQLYSPGCEHKAGLIEAEETSLKPFTPVSTSPGQFKKPHSGFASETVCPGLNEPVKFPPNSRVLLTEIKTLFTQCLERPQILYLKAECNLLLLQFEVFQCILNEIAVTKQNNA